MSTIYCAYMSVLRFWSCLLQGEKLGSADRKKVWVSRQEDGELAVSLLT